MGGCFSKFKFKKTSLDWVPVSEYNTRSNCNQSRKQTNNTSDQELTDLDNSVAYESGFGRFVPVRPQPRALPLTVQNRENLPADHHDDAASTSSHTLHPYAHQMQNGLIPHSNHAAAAVMIVNPTTPNAVAGNMSQQFNGPNQNRNNLTRNLNSTRNTFEGNNSNNNNTPNSRSGTKSVNLMNNMYDQGQGSFNNINENNQPHRESARALGEAIVAACPDAAAVERRLGQIREYIRVTSSLVDTMRNSEDEAFINHTKEEYDELVKMVMQLKESETKLESMLVQMQSSNAEALNEGIIQSTDQEVISITELESKNDSTPDQAVTQDKSCNIKTNNDKSATNVNLKKVTNIENEHLNKTITNTRGGDENQTQNETVSENEDTVDGSDNGRVEIKEIESVTCAESEVKKDDKQLNDMLRKNIMACVEKIAIMEEMRNKNKDSSCSNDQQDVVVRPVSVQSNGSAYSENELWQNEIKNKMELSQIRLSALKQQQKRLLKYQAEAKQQLEELNKERQSEEIHHPSTSHENFNGMQNLTLGANYQHPNRMYGANQIGVATTLPHSSEALSGAAGLAGAEPEHARSTHSGHSQDERFSLRDGNIASSEEAAGGGRDSEVEDDEGLVHERGRALQAKLRELQLKKQHMENLVSEFQKLQMATRLGSSHNTYSSSGEDSGEDESSRKCNKSGVNLKNEDPFKLMEIKAIKTALQKTKDLMRSVETFETDHLPDVHEDSFHLPGHSNIHDNKSEGGGSMGGWSNEGSVCRVRNTLPQRHKFTNEQHSQQQVQHQQQLQQQHLQAQQHQQHLQAQQHQQHLQAQQHQQHLQAQQHQQHLQAQQQQHQQHMQSQNQQQSHEANINTLQQLAQELRMETEKIMGERARITDSVTNKERKQKKVNEEVRVRGGPAGPAERRQMQLRALLADKQRELEALLNKETLTTPSEVQKMKTDSRAASVVNQSYNSEQEEPESRSEHVPMDSQNSRDTENFRGGGDSVLGTRSINTVPSHLGSAYGSDSDSASRNKSNQRNRPRRRPAVDRQTEENNVTVTNNNNNNVNMRQSPRADSSNVNLVPPVAQNNDVAGNVPYSHLPPTCWNTNKSNQDTRTNQFTQNSHSQTMDRLLGTPQMSFPPSLPYNMMMPYGMVGACGCGCGLWGAWCWQQLVLQQREIHALRDQLAHLEERWRAETASHTLNNQVPPGNRANNYWDNFRSYSRQNLLSAHGKSNAEGQPPPPPAAAQPLAERSHNSLRRASSSASPSPSPSLTPKRNTDAPHEPRRARSPPAPAPAPAPARTLDFSPTSNVDIASAAADAPNPNLAPAARDAHDKATSKLFDLLRENVYSEVTTLIDANEAHPDFLVQLFRELQPVSSEPLRRRVLQSIRGALAPASRDDEPVSSSGAEPAACRACGARGACSAAGRVDDGVVRFLVTRADETFDSELLEALASLIGGGSAAGRRSRRLVDSLAKYEGSRVCDVSSDIIESLPRLSSGEDEEGAHPASEISESSMLQDVAGSLNLFSASETRLHAMNACAYDAWADDGSARSSREGELELGDRSEMRDGDLAEADQTCRADAEAGAAGPPDAPHPPPGADALPDVVDAEEVTPTEAEAEWLGLDRVPTRLHMDESSEKQKD